MNLNHHSVALMGRSDEVMLCRYEDAEISLPDWGSEIFDDLHTIANWMDSSSGTHIFRETVKTEQKKLTDKSLLPSEQMHRQMKDGNLDFLEYGKQLANQHKNNRTEDSNDEEQSIQQT